MVSQLMIHVDSKMRKEDLVRLLCQQFPKIVFRFKVVKPGFQKPNVVNDRLTSLWKLDLNLSEHFNVLSMFLKVEN